LEVGWQFHKTGVLKEQKKKKKDGERAKKIKKKGGYRGSTSGNGPGGARQPKKGGDGWENLVLKKSRMTVSTFKSAEYSNRGEKSKLKRDRC